MTPIILRIIAGSLALVAFFCFAFSFYLRKKGNAADTIFMALGFVLLASASFFLIASYCFFECPNCNEWYSSNYCPECGTDLSAPIVCSGCERKYGKGYTLPYCSDCGTSLKGGV